MWLVLGLGLLGLLGWGLVALAHRSDEVSEDLAAMHTERDTPLGIWGIFRRRR